MAWGMHKPGQGYWVRVMTAAMIGIIAFATGGWLWGQMAVLAEKLPVRAWTAEVAQVAGGEPAAGQRVQLRGSAPITGGGSAPVLGTAEVKAYDATNAIITLHDFKPAREGARADAAASIAPAEGAAQGFSANIRNSLRGERAVPAIYLQGGALALALIVGAALAFYFAGMKPRTVEFLIATDMEMKKVNWSTRKDISRSTGVVVGAALIIATLLFGIDVLFQQFFQLIGVLQ